VFVINYNSKMRAYQRTNLAIWQEIKKQTLNHDISADERSLRYMERCKKIMVAGAKAGIKQKGKAPKASTPCDTVSMDNFVSIKAVTEVATISRKPKVFHIHVNTLAEDHLSLMALTTIIDDNAVTRSPIPDSKAMDAGKAL